MNILIIPSWFPNKKNKINGSFFLEQAIEISNNGHNVYVIDASYQGRDGYFELSNILTTKKKVNDVIIYRKTFPAFGLSKRNKKKYIVFEYNVKRLIKKILKEVKIDVIHTHSYLPAGYALTKISKYFNIPHVMTEHSSSIVSGSVNDNNKRILSETLENTSTVIAVGNVLRRKLLEYNGDNEIIVIPNIVSPIFQYKDKNVKNEFIFSSIGYLEDRKNYSTLIRAFYLAFKEQSNVKLRIIGDGILYYQLRKEIESYGMMNQISLLGLLTRDQTAYELQESHAFVMISKAETFGVVYIEALATGCPVIGLKNGGAEYIIEDRFGILINDNDEVEISKALKEMIKNYNKYDKKSISEDILSKYSGESVVCQLEKVYKKALEKENNNEASTNE